MAFLYPSAKWEEVAKLTRPDMFKMNLQLANI